MLRVLRPEGRLADAVWDTLHNNRAYADEVELLQRIAGSPAADVLRAPFALGDRHELKTLFETAGAAEVTITTHRGRARFPSARAMVEADLRGWLPVFGVVVPEDQIRLILEAAGQVLSAHVTKPGTVEFDTSVHIITATAPPVT